MDKVAEYSGLGAGIGSVVPGVGTTIGGAIGGIVGGISDLFDSIFGKKEDKGHWEGNVFIPGDLQNRYNTVYQWIYQMNINPDLVDWNKIDSILKSTGIWQDSIKNYLNSLKGKTSAQTTSLTKTSLPETLTTTIETETDYTTYLIPAAILILIIFILIKK